MMEDQDNPNDAARELGRRGGLKGGKARAEKLSPEQRSEQARRAVQARWARNKGIEHGGSSITPLEASKPEKPEVLPSTDALPVAKYKGVLDFRDIGGLEIPCYVLEGGRRVIGRTSFTEMLTSIKGGGDLEKYLGVKPLRPFIDLEDVQSRMIPFRLPEVEGLEREVKGIPADLAIDVCRGFVAARDARLLNPDYDPPFTPRQMDMAIKAGMFLAACAKVGLDALIDEATGYQYDRARDALQVKLRAYLTEEMRKWEKTFPDELWTEFARLTNWKGSVTQRPKYWGNLVTELVYEYLDPDVAKWLKENKPSPAAKGEYWHLPLTKEYGVKKLLEHIWTLIGIAKTSQDINDLRTRMRRIFGATPYQMMFDFDRNRVGPPAD
jgi:hypothetical protein